MNDFLSDIQKITFKKRLLSKCVELISLRIETGTEAIANAQAAANAEEKSSAGDKYETSRAMNHLEKDMHSRQLSANRNELAALSVIDCGKVYDSVTAGSFMQCDDCCFFVAAGLGRINFENLDIYLLAPQAPVAKLLFGKTTGNSIFFNKKEMLIRAVF